eukprot:1158006-Pelagomonas_calceolata.AAC.7
MEPWSSARRATVKRRSPDRILVAGVEKRMPSIGGSHWEVLSLMHAAERQAQKKKKYVGRGISPHINLLKGGTLTQKSHKSPPPQSRIKKGYGGFGGLLESPGFSTWL